MQHPPRWPPAAAAAGVAAGRACPPQRHAAPCLLTGVQAAVVHDPVTGRPSSHAVLWFESVQRARDVIKVGVRRRPGRAWVGVAAALLQPVPLPVQQRTGALPPPASGCHIIFAPPQLPSNPFHRCRRTCKRWSTCSTARRAPWTPRWRCQVGWAPCPCRPPQPPCWLTMRQAVRGIPPRRGCCSQFSSSLPACLPAPAPTMVPPRRPRPRLAVGVRSSAALLLWAGRLAAGGCAAPPAALPARHLAAVLRRPAALAGWAAC